MRRWIDDLDELAGLDMILARGTRLGDGGRNAAGHHRRVTSAKLRRHRILESLRAMAHGWRSNTGHPRDDVPRRS